MATTRSEHILHLLVQGRLQAIFTPCNILSFKRSHYSRWWACSQRQCHCSSNFYQDGKDVNSTNGSSARHDFTWLYITIQKVGSDVQCLSGEVKSLQSEVHQQKQSIHQIQGKVTTVEIEMSALCHRISTLETRGHTPFPSTELVTFLQQQQRIRDIYLFNYMKTYNFCMEIRT